MAIKITVSDTVRFKVAGTINDDKGTAQPFDFTLDMQRLSTTDQVNEYLAEMNSDEGVQPITNALAKRARGWAGPMTESNEPVPFSDTAFRNLMAVPGLAFLVHSRYLRESGAKEKN